MALTAGVWQTIPLWDSLVFSEAEGADLAEVSRRQWYMDRLDIAELRLEHADTDAQIEEYQAMAAYYPAKIAQMDEGEK